MDNNESPPCDRCARVVALESSVADVRRRLDEHEQQLLLLSVELHAVKGDTSRILSASTRHGLVLDKLYSLLAVGQDGHRGGR